MAEFKEMQDVHELNEVLNESSRKRVLIFKHSTKCPISGQAWQEVQDYIKESLNNSLVVMIKVIESRPVSNLIAEKLNVTHQSPQIILLDHQQVLWTASHFDITRNNIEKALIGDFSSNNALNL